MKFARINIKLLPIKIHYLLFMGGLASALPFRTVFAKQLGLSATAVGVIFLAVPFLKIITNPLFGVILDYFKKFRLTIGIIIVIVAVCHIGMVFIPPLTNAEKAHLEKNFRTKVKFIPQNNSENFLNSRAKLRLESVLENSNGTMQNFSCVMKCDSVPSVEKTRDENEKHVPCNNSFSFEINVLVKLYGCRINVSLRKTKVFLEQSIYIVDKQDILEADFNQEETRRNAKCLEAVIDDFKSKNLTKRIKTDSEFHGELEIMKNELTFSNGLSMRSLKSNRFNFTETKEYEIMFKNNSFQQKFDSAFCSEEITCVSKHCALSAETEFYDEMSKDEFLTYQFWSLFILTAVSSVTFCAVMFMMDAVCYEMLDKKEDYGQQRLWGTIGWGLGALVGGYLNDALSFSFGEIDYAPCFYFLAIVIMFDLIPLFFLDVGTVKYSPNICKDVGLLLSKPDVLINVLIVFTIGVLSGLIWNYQFWFMVEIGASQVLLGLSQTFECLLAELPCFIFSGWIIKKAGYNNCNSITFLCFAFRYLCFAYMYDPWMTLPAALLHGPTFGLFYASMTMYAKDEAPPGTEATVQALLSMSFEGVGAGIGSILGGIGVDKFGSRETFLYAAIGSFILLLVNIVLQATILNEKNKKKGKDVALKVIGSMGGQKATEEKWKNYSNGYNFTDISNF